MKLKRLKNLFFLHLANLPVKSIGVRPLLAKWGGGYALITPKAFLSAGMLSSILIIRN